MRTVLELLGGITSAAAVVGLAVGGWRWRRERQLRDRLLQDLNRLLLSRRVTVAAVESDRRLADGVGWAGVSLWPPRLSGLLSHLVATAEECDHTVARLRSYDASGGLERLRRDVEQLAVVIGEAADVYKRGTIATFQQHSGEPIPVSAGGREPTVTVPDDELDVVWRLKRDAQQLGRTCGYRLRGDNRTPDLTEIGWPLQRWEVADAPATDELWRGLPRPLEG